MPNITAPPIPSTEGVEAVDEAIRNLSEAAQNGAAEAQRALNTTRSFVSDILALNSKTIGRSASNLETMFKAGFGLQNSILAAAPPVMDANFAAAKSALEAYATLAERQQNILLGAWQRGVNTVERLAPASK